MTARGEIYELQQLVEFRSGGTPSRKSARFWGGDLPWVTAKDLKSFRITDSIDRLTADGATKARIAKPGTILVLVRGMGLFKDFPVGLVDRALAFNQDIKALEPNGKVDAEYLAYYLVSRRAQIMERVDQAGHGTGRLDTEYLRAFPIPVPPLAEQRRIADILDAWDRAIAHTEALIGAKCQRFNWLYSELFPASGTSLPASWEAAPVTSVATVRFSGVDKKTVEGEKPVRLCNYTDVFNNRRIIADMPFMSATAKPREIEAFTLRLGDVVFTKDSETAEEIGESAVVAEPLGNVVCGYHLGVARARPDTMIGDFLALALRHPWVREEFRKAANGVTRFGLNLDVMDQVHVLFPPLDQQQRLIATLNTVEDEIELLTKSLTPLREQKKGLMQKLLSGDMRLSSMEAAE